MTDRQATEIAVRRMNDTLRQIRAERNRVEALQRLDRILAGTTSRSAATVSATGRIKGWFRKQEKDEGHPALAAIDLTQDEISELRTWLREHAEKRSRQADEMEAKLAIGATDD